MGWMCVCVLFIYINSVCLTKVRYDPRVTVKNEGITRFSFESPHSGFIKMVSASGGKIIWVGRNETLYSITPAQDIKPQLVNVNLCKNESGDSCAFTLSLLNQGSDGNLFYCGSDHENTKCCYLKSDYSLTDCFKLENYQPKINEPSLLVGEMVYFTKSEVGLYRINKDKNYNLWSQSTQTEQTYLKLIAGKGQHKDKVYSFFAEKQKSKDGESEQWIPRVSQCCMNDRGGPKAHLQNSWTSMIYARLFCGRGYEFSQLIDVATLETDDDIKIYALFRNFWNMSAVCVYSMTKISSIFTSSDFNSSTVPANHRPGTKVGGSIKSWKIRFSSSRSICCSHEGHTSPAHFWTLLRGRLQDPRECQTPITAMHAGAPFANPSQTEFGGETSSVYPAVHIPPSSRYFLLCPMTSHHATYNWHHKDTYEECVVSNQDCLYLIHSMNETLEGSYRCVSTEEGYNRTVTRYTLRMSRSNAHRLASGVLLLLTAAHFLF
ncbi:semaphorin-7A isoform X4 [Pseudorasbora parva]|uniref:semaphorin-7A isoform X4 n=1 Tax=Pseudorasbora parva TaxID=51549 RepID=UPI00351F6ECC